MNAKPHLLKGLLNAVVIELVVIAIIVIVLI
jgi:hypothetical protein